MTYQEYLSSPYAVNIDEQDFPRYYAYAKVAINQVIDSLVAHWIDTSPCKEAIDEAIAQQIAVIHDVGISNMVSGKIVKSESMDGYSQTYDYVMSGDTLISVTAKYTLECAFRKKGLMYRGV